MRARKWWLLSLVVVGCGDDGGSTDTAAGDAGRPDASRPDAGSVDDALPGPGVDIPIGDALADGQVVAPWDRYCVATFTRDFDVLSRSGAVAFSVQEGDRYLLGDEDFFSDASLIYIADGAAAEFKLDFEGRPAPFSSSCGNNAAARIGVFVDTVVYADAALSAPVCTVQAGQLMSANGYNFALSGQGYSVDLAGLARLCDGVTAGYVAPVSVDTEDVGVTGLPFVGLQVPAR